MNGIFSIELAQQHQQELRDHAAKSRIALRASRSSRPSLVDRLRHRRRAGSPISVTPTSAVTNTACAH